MIGGSYTRTTYCISVICGNYRIIGEGNKEKHRPPQLTNMPERGKKNQFRAHINENYAYSDVNTSFTGLFDSQRCKVLQPFKYNLFKFSSGTGLLFFSVD